MAFIGIQSGKVVPVVVDTQGVRALVHHKAGPSSVWRVCPSYVARKGRMDVSMNSIPAQMNVMPRMNHSDSTTNNQKGDAQYEHHTRNLPWFQKAVEDIVRKLDGRVDTDQFVQVVKMGSNPCQADFMATCDITASGHPTCRVDNVDAVILVKRIASGVDLKTHLDVDVVQTDAVTEPSNGDVQIACDQLMRSDVGRRILHGRVGECCEREMASEDSPSAASVLVNQGTRHAASRVAVKAAALPKQPFHGYWGVVVQAKDKSSIEGCYLLKAGCSVVDGGCSCTHFSLTRVQSEHVSVHQQFVDSWRA